MSHISIVSVPTLSQRLVSHLQKHPDSDAEFDGARLILLQMLGADPSKANIRSNTLHKPGQDVAEFRHVTRVKHLADTLYQLRFQPIIEDICKRFREKRKFDSTYYEAVAARFFVDEGCVVHPGRKTGRRGEDFDFHAETPLGDRVNVEVSMAVSNNDPRATLRNKFNKKRGQLPDTDPSIVFMSLPESWGGLVNLDDEIDYASASFFRSTSRVNFVVFLLERYIESPDASGNGELELYWYPRRNNSAAKPLWPMRLLSDELRSTGRLGLRSDFERWVRKCRAKAMV